MQRWLISSPAVASGILALGFFVATVADAVDVLCWCRCCRFGVDGLLLV